MSQIRSTLWISRQTMAVAALILAAACSTHKSSAEPNDNSTASHIAQLHGIVLSANGVPIDSVLVVVRVPTRDSAYYELASMVTGFDGTFDLELRRILQGTWKQVAPDTITAELSATAWKRRDLRPDGSPYSVTSHLLLTFAPKGLATPVATETVQLALVR
jgi:hypothetical protein